MPRKPATPKPRALLSRGEVAGLCQRILKDKSYQFKRDAFILYSLMKEYPDRDFWLNYTLSWQPDSMVYFLSEHGKAQLSRDWATFSLDMPAQPEYKLEDAKVGEDVVIDKRPKTVADLLK